MATRGGYEEKRGKMGRDIKDERRKIWMHTADAADGVKLKNGRGVKLFFGSVRLHSRFDTSRTIGKRFGFLLSPR